MTASPNRFGEARAGIAHHDLPHPSSPLERGGPRERIRASTTAKARPCREAAREQCSRRLACEAAASAASISFHLRRPRFATLVRSVSAWLLLAAPGTALATAEGHGYAELRASGLTGTTGQRWQLVQRARPTLNMRVTDRVALGVTVEASLSQGRDLNRELRRTLEESDLGPVLEAAGCTWPDRGHDVFRVREAGDYLEVDRLYLDIYRESFDLRLGRQSIHWGSARFLNPTDPFPEVLLAEPWRPRRGVNAARLTVPFAAFNELTAVAAIDDGLEDPRLAGRARLDLAGVTVALIAAWRGDQDDALLGLDLRGTNIVGWWAEAAFFPGSDPHADLAVGLDYSFPLFDRTVVLAQYYRGGAGATRPEDYARSPALAGADLPTCKLEGIGGEEPAPPDLGAAAEDRSPFAPVLAARDYLLLGGSFTFTPDLMLDAYVLQNLNDGTAFAMPTLTYIATGRLDISLSAQVPFSTWGDGGEFRPRPRDTLVQYQLDPEAEPIEVDLSGLVPTSTVTLWARLSL